MRRARRFTWIDGICVGVVPPAPKGRSVVIKIDLNINSCFFLVLISAPTTPLLPPPNNICHVYACCDHPCVDVQRYYYELNLDMRLQFLFRFIFFFFLPLSSLFPRMCVRGRGVFGGRPFNYDRITDTVILGRLPRNAADLDVLKDKEGNVLPFRIYF